VKHLRDRLHCWIHGHEPIIRDDMLVTIPYREIDCGHTIIRFMGRTFAIGITTCSRCGHPLRVAGTTTIPIQV
jgi:hypothetical protein